MAYIKKIVRGTWQCCVVDRWSHNSYNSRRHQRRQWCQCRASPTHPVLRRWSLPPHKCRSITPSSSGPHSWLRRPRTHGYASGFVLFRRQFLHFFPAASKGYNMFSKGCFEILNFNRYIMLNGLLIEVGWLFGWILNDFCWKWCVD